MLCCLGFVPPAHGGQAQKTGSAGTYTGYGKFIGDVEGMIPGGRVAFGNVVRGEVTLDNIKFPDIQGIRAWFADATDRYDHGVLGDRLEGSSLKVQHRGEERVYSYTLGSDAVFEDIEPRFADLDGDGFPEIIAVKSYLDSGATITVFGIRNEELVPLAEAEPIGTPHRWLNPAGAADYDGDGRIEIAIVKTPHILGRLMFYEWTGKPVLVPEFSRKGYSTHRIGSTELMLSTTIDWNGDGTPDLILPRQDHETIDVISMKGGEFAILQTYDLPAKVATQMRSGNKVWGERWFSVGLSNGKGWWEASGQ